ncbi:bacterial Ig-like domain-containing protein, partial [Erysipelatoclostridium ramosum]|nr:bacterial Ig-like domain-containing protein [Thomasclavelia ramosa]
MKGGTIRVSFKGGEADQLIQLSNSGVEVTGYDPSKLGEQHLQVSYLGQKLDQSLTVYVVSHSEAGEKTPVGLEL